MKIRAAIGVMTLGAAAAALAVHDMEHDQIYASASAAVGATPPCTDHPAPAPTTGPDEAAWVVRDGLTVPSAPDIGPHINEFGVTRCFVADATGALFAMVHMQATDTSLRQARLTAVDPAWNGQTASVVGYRVTPAPTGSFALTVVLRDGGGTEQAVAAQMNWTGDDWAADLDSIAVGVAQHLDGVTPWGPGR